MKQLRNTCTYDIDQKSSIIKLALALCLYVVMSDF